MQCRLQASVRWLCHRFDPLGSAGARLEEGALLFVVIGAVLVYPRLTPIALTGLLALFTVWWWRRSH